LYTRYTGAGQRASFVKTVEENYVSTYLKLLAFYCVNKDVLLDILSGQRNIELCHPFFLLRRKWYLILT
jgi:hypothetical protein